MKWETVEVLDNSSILQVFQQVSSMHTIDQLLCRMPADRIMKPVDNITKSCTTNKARISVKVINT